MSEHVAIIGGGQSGASVALHLRDLGYGGRITLFCEEPHAPYQRPPLSKKYLSGEWGADRLELRSSDAWKALDITVLQKTPVLGLDLSQRRLDTPGAVHGWDHLVLATGAVARARPPGFAGRRNVFELRTIADVTALREMFHAGSRLVVIGGGFIGLETAAVARKAGLEVHVVERAPRILERAVGPATSAWLRSLHLQHGVEILEGITVASTSGAEALEAIHLDTGRSLAADVVLVGIGVLPQDRLAVQAGIACDNGIAVDGFGRTSAPGVWACGDCASFPLGERRLRLESVQNAVDQAKTVAADIMGKAQAYAPHPWFWSDQYDAKLQIAGLIDGFDAMIPRAGRAGMAHWYFRGDRFLAVETMNDPAAFMTGRKILETGAALSPASMAQEGFDPRSCLR